MTSKQRIKEYQGQLHELLNASGELDNVIIERTKKLIRELKDAIIARTVEISARSRDFGGFEPEWGPYWMSRLVAEYNMVIQDTSEKFKKDLSEYTIKAYEIGSDIADKGLDFENPGASATVPKLTTEQMRLASQFPGDMITGMQEKQLAAITKVLSFSMSRGEGAGKFMARISGKISKGPWSDTYYRAEVIARTETARIQELARKQRSIVQGRAFPGIQQFSQYLCEPRGVYPCKKCEQYDGNVYDAFGKLHIQAPGRSDEEKMPELPLHPNCLCNYVSYIPGISRNPQEGKPDDPVPVDNLAILKWNESLGVWSLKLPFDHGFRTISTLPKNSQYDELKAAANRLILETGLQLEEVFLEIMLPGEMAGPSQDPNKKRNERAVDSVIGQKLSKDLLDSPRSLRPSEEDL